MARRRDWCWLLIGLLLLPAGCVSTKNKKSGSSAAVKAEVTESFEKLKVAIPELLKGETEKLWDILAAVSHEEAAKKAKAFRADFATLDKEKQAELAQQMGATATEIRDKLSGYGYLRLVRDRLYENYWMVAAAPIDHIKLEAADEATVYYTQDDSEQEKKSIVFILEEGQWKAVLRIPEME